MRYSKILKIIYNKNNLIKFIIICILAYIIYFLYYRINRINEGFDISSIKYISNVKSILIHLPAQGYLDLSGIFVYDENGNSINLVSVGTASQSSDVDVSLNAPIALIASK